MPRPKSRAKVEANHSSFLEALKFANLICKSEGSPNETHLLLHNNHLVAFNGILACGCRITEDINCAPNAELIVQALSKCGDNLSITQLDNNRLSIKSGKFKCIIPCIEPSLLGVAIPDPPQAIIDDRFKEAVEAVAPLASETAQSVITASILIAGASVLATNRHVMMEFWHGIDLPYGIAIPKAFATTLSKIQKKLIKFGFSQSSTTFYFDDESWLRTQFYAEPWPDIRNILDAKCNLWPVPNDFWKAIDAIEPFSDECIYFDQGLIKTHADSDEGATYECYGIPKGPIYLIKQLKLIRPYAKQIDFMAPGIHNNSYMLMWQGDQCRGAIAGRI